MNYEKIYKKYFNDSIDEYIAEHQERLFDKYHILNGVTRLQSSFLNSLQNKFGNAIEDIVHQFLNEQGAQYLPRDIIPNKDCDQIFQINDYTVLIEQKIRDDHDSTKKEGQVNNYNYKINWLNKHYKNVIGIFWFIDKTLIKNKDYYETQINDTVYYGDEIISKLNLLFNNNNCNKLIYTIEEGIQFLQNKVKENYIINNPFINYYIDYHKLSGTNLVHLLNNDNYEYIKNTFLYNTSVSELIAYLKNKRQTQSVKKLIIFLTEKEK